MITIWWQTGFENTTIPSGAKANPLIEEIMDASPSML
jgi:hypothetical protein|tara:strand:+ start:111 stop:221 length:111 start_codon:yes stop_codon:yes gene_type:complete